MRDFFSLDGAFNKYGGMLADMVIVSLMWLLFTAATLGIAAGASTAALFYVTTRRISDREGYITRDFWEAFKANFKRATVIWLIILGMLLLLYNNILLILDAEAGASGIFSIVLPAQLVFIALILLMSVYIYPLIARFDMGLVQVCKSAFFMAVRHFLTSITCVALVVGVLFLFFQFPPLLIVAPGLYAWLASMMIMRVFKKYRPEMDKDPMLEIAELEAARAEEKRRREFNLGSGDSEDEERRDFWDDVEEERSED
ncbi:MAG: DUF624 domain-containing protein [Defluviitaleaceae bacterium]|nr:DUF624 domain-containing protein [Defluviitaleaceae bacterium]MCL2275924.1 DUF624 domain-containing protein [Defluviitaleaceae bacterium]